MLEYSVGAMDWLLDIIYDDTDAFRLRICHGAGTEYEHYVDNIIAMDEQAVSRLIAGKTLIVIAHRPPQEFTARLTLA